MSENATNLNRQGAEIIPEVWSMSLSKKLDKSGVGMKIVNKVYEKDTSHYGDTVNIGEIGDVNVVDYSEDEFDEDTELAGEVRDEDEDFEDFEDFEDEFDTEEDFIEDNDEVEDIEEAFVKNYEDYLDDEEEDDYRYNELVRRRGASERRNFKRNR